MSTLLALRPTHAASHSLTLNRPEIRNAFDDALIGELTGAFRTLGADDNVRALVLTGAGTAFSAGGDLNWMRRMAGYDEARKYRRRHGPGRDAAHTQ